jgi:PAS domain S-box-containing protein
VVEKFRSKKEGAIEIMLSDFEASTGGPAPSKRSHEIDAKQVELLYGHVSVGLIATSINAVALTMVLWSLISPIVLVVWLTCTELIVLLRYGLLRQYRNLTRVADRDRHWGRWFLLGTVMSGSCWGSASLFLYADGSVPHQAFLAFVLAGMTAGAVAIYSARVEAFLGYILPALVPITVRFFVEGDAIHRIMGAMIGLFLVLMLATARRVHNTIEKSLRSEVERSAELARTNDQLKMQLDERRRAEDALRQSEARFRRLFESNIIGITLIEIGGEILDANDAFLGIVGYSRQELNAGLRWDEMTPPEYRQLVDQAIEEMKCCGTCRPFEKVYVRKDGSRVPVLLGCALLEGSRHQAISFVLDLTEHKRDEQALELHSAQLARSNAELERFAYIASHDLKEPLHTITAFAQLLAKRYQGQLDPNGGEYIGYIVDGAKRMYQLIDDLLAYSRLTSCGKEVKPTASEGALESALGDLQAAVKETGAVITHDFLPTVMADNSELTRLFQNLISNALKFRCEKPPQVHVSAELKGTEWIFSVRDNGIGIDPQFAERIFIIFQRLHGQGLYPGTGIGLAVCKKIVEHHEGRIWVESQPGKGATFYFTLPSPPQIQKVTLSSSAAPTGR